MGLFKRKEKDDLSAEIEAYRQQPDINWSNMPNTEPGSLKVDDVFWISGRGTVVTGTVSSGVFHTGDRVVIQDGNGNTRESTIAGLEAFRKQLEIARAGDVIGMLLTGIGRSDVEPGNHILRL